MQIFSPHTSHARGMAIFISTMLLLSNLLSTAIAGSIELPSFGDPSGRVMTPTQERRLGQAFMRNVRKSLKVVSDPLLNSYIESLGMRLVSNSSDANQPFSFFLVDNKEVNAFAGPAGNIAVFTGLILTTESESELASVVAHEIAHITQKHLARTFDSAERMGIPTAAIMLAAVILGAASNNSDVGAAAAAGIQAGLIQQQINFTRENEKEADRVGINILADSKFDPRAMPTFFTRLGKVNMVYDGHKLPEFLQTHPISKNRMADTLGRAATYPYRQYQDSKEYHLTRAILREQQFNDPNQAVKFYSKTLAEGRYRNAQAQRYGLVRALIRTHKYQEAMKHINLLLNKDRSSVHYLTTKAEIYSQTSRPKQAIKILQKGLKLNPDNYPLTTYYANALLHNGQAAKAERILEQLIKRHPQDTTLNKMAAMAAGKAGHIAQGHYFMAEHYYLSGDLESAQRQLEISLNNSRNDFYISAKMAARLKDIKQEISDLKQRKH
ncbi:MAG: M48 family metallopeptidase [Gammaproteobacteria bacterium]|nr:M48 family metallopeptidase [Gammaproteobacteria bacterium]